MRKSAPVRIPARGDRLRVVVAAMTLVAILFPARSIAASDTVLLSVVPGPIGYVEPPSVPGDSTPDVPVVPLPGQAGLPEAMNARMGDFEVTDATGAGDGWNITVSGVDGPGKCPVLKQYCPNRTCGPDTGPGYVSDGATLPANSLLLDSSGASFSPKGGTTGVAPTHECDSGCFVDAPPASPTKIVVAAAGAGMGRFQTRGFSSSSVALAAPRTVGALPAGEVYRVDLAWSLNNGP
jgi:hypothetical protein